MKLLILGPPGAGKGTQAQIVAEKYGIPHISTGAIFRANIKQGTELGMNAKKYMDKGLLVPDQVTNNMMKGRLFEEDCKNGFLIDGYPRNMEQVKALNEATKIDYVINIVINKEEIVSRLLGRRICSCGAFYNMNVDFLLPKVEGICDKCGAKLVQRVDDNEDSIRNRLRVYEEQSSPVINYFKPLGKVINVDGTCTIEEVTALIYKALEE